MGKYFSDVVEQAIADIYYCYCYDNTRAKAAEAALALAVEQGDGDACYFLSRCFSGKNYHWEYHPFEENDRTAYELLCKGVRLGSAASVLGALRRGMLTPALREEMPFSSLEEAWRERYRKAEQVQKSAQWYAEAFEGGMGIAGRGLRAYYQEGRGTRIPPDQRNFLLTLQQGAELGYPDWMFHWAFELYFHLGRKQEGLDYARRAAEQGHLKGWMILGHAYRYGNVAEQSFSKALACYEKSAAFGNDSYASSQLGELYFLGLGVKQDYATAVQYLEQSYALDSDNTNLGMLGVCCLLGWGCKQDSVRGRTLLTQMNCRDSQYKSYGLGRMYAEGIGVPEDIEKGVRYLRAAGDYEPAKEALKQYKKSIFGVWRRRR